jgi:hypothetical protein
MEDVTYRHHAYMRVANLARPNESQLGDNMTSWHALIVNIDESRKLEGSR